MPEKISWNFAMQISGGPRVAGSGDMEVDAYSKLNVVVPENEDIDVELQPGSGGAVQLLVLSPTSPGPDLTYTIGTDTMALDGPVVLIGGGAVGLLAETISTVKFTNGAAEPAEISILMGRDAIP